MNKVCIGCDVEFSVTSNSQKYCTPKCCKKAGAQRYRDRRRLGVPLKKKSKKWNDSVRITKEQALVSERNRYFDQNVKRRNGKIDFRLTQDEFNELVFLDCFYCGAKPNIRFRSSENYRNSIDRIDSSLDYTYDNCLPCCWDCNRMKGVLSIGEFATHISRISNNLDRTSRLVKRPYSLEDRAKFYNESYPRYPKMWADKNWLLGVWSIGNNYKNNSRYHGAFPRDFLERFSKLFPEKENTLHLFSGSLPPGNYTRFDIGNNDEAQYDVRGDAQELSSHFEPDTFDMIIADPPYTEEDAQKYGNPLINRNKVLKECHKVLKPGGHLVWMDMVLPMYRKDEFKRIGEISISRSTNHRVRAVFIFERQ
jgi:hypothetical protein